MKRYFILTLHSIALVAVVALIASHFEYDGPVTIIASLVAIIVGYVLGSWTCHLHKSKHGFWITIAVFVALNLLHSTIDGASIGDVPSFAQDIAVLSHELARQPALYIVLWGMLTPFIANHYSRLAVLPVAVTGIWMLGAYLGFRLFETITEVPWLEIVADSAIYLFLGDIIHHLIEEYHKLKRTDTCCHEIDGSMSME